MIQVRWTAFVLCLLSVVSGQLDLPPYRNEDAGRQIPSYRNEDTSRQIPPYRNEDVDRQFPYRDDDPGRPPHDINYQDILARLDFLGTERCSANVIAQWTYETNVNEHTQLQAVR